MAEEISQNNQHKPSPTEGNDSLTQLGERVMDGDPTVFADIYHFFLDKVLWLIYRNLKKIGIDNMEEAEELTAKVFIKAWKNLDQFDNQIGNMRQWLFGIAKNETKTFWRELKRHEQLIEKYCAKLMNEPSANGVEHLVEQAIQMELANEAFKALPERTQRIIELRQEGYSNKEIARALQLADGTISSHISRGLELIRQNIILMQLQKAKQSVQAEGTSNLDRVSAD